MKFTLTIHVCTHYCTHSKANVKKDSGRWKKSGNNTKTADLNKELQHVE